jgi:hypothetical protein
MKEIGVPIVDTCLVPDAAAMGYTPQQAIEWYEAIGEHGRSIYFQLFLLDECIMIPSYVLFCGSQLVPTGASATITENSLSYLAVATGVFDLIETVTHGCAVAGSWKPSNVHLILASAATQFKSAGCVVLLFATVVRNIVSVGKKKHS